MALVGLLEERTWGDNGENKALELNCSNVELYDWPEGGSVSPGISAPSAAERHVGRLYYATEAAEPEGLSVVIGNILGFYASGDLPARWTA